MPTLKQILDKQPKRIDLSEYLSDAFYKDKNITKGSVLKFNQDGVIHSYKIIRLNRKSKKCEAIEVFLYKEDEVDIVDKESE